MKNRKKKTEKIARYMRRARWDSYSILFNLCGSPGFYHRNQNKKNNKCAFFVFSISISRFPAEKSSFFRVVFYKIGKKLSP